MCVEYDKKNTSHNFDGETHDHIFFDFFIERKIKKLTKKIDHKRLTLNKKDRKKNI